MHKYLNKEQAYDKCIINGNITPRDRIDIEKIESTLEIAKDDFSFANEIKKKNKGYNALYNMYYNIIHLLVEAILRFDQIKVNNHQCLFAYLCVKHPELELDWNFFEKIRTKRNGINYYGIPVSREDFKEIDLQINLYIKTLCEEIKRKLQD
ncbi:MAG: hypothetical protein H8D38_04865 [DPANN group archaeon]|nr:hypothetical protein [DPANN group archaeon]